LTIGLLYKDEIVLEGKGLKKNLIIFTAINYIIIKLMDWREFYLRILHEFIIYDSPALIIKLK